MIISRHKPQVAGTPLVSDVARMVRDHRDKRRHRDIIASYKACHPVCLACLVNGHTGVTAEVHHIRRVSEGGATVRDNLLALCKPCHLAVGKLDEATQVEIKAKGEELYNASII